MPQPQQSPRTSLVIPILLITFGALFLYATWRPAFDPWPILRTYWPLILIFIGLGKMWDATRQRQNPGAPRANFSVGSTVGILVFVLVLVALFWHGRAFSRDRRSSFSHLQHESRTVERQDANVHERLHAVVLGQHVRSCIADGIRLLKHPGQNLGRRHATRQSK